MVKLPNNSLVNQFHKWKLWTTILVCLKQKCQIWQVLLNLLAWHNATKRHKPGAVFIFFLKVYSPKSPNRLKTRAEKSISASGFMFATFETLGTLGFSAIFCCPVTRQQISAHFPGSLGTRGGESPHGAWAAGGPRLPLPLFQISSHASDLRFIYIFQHISISSWQEAVIYCQLKSQTIFVWFLIAILVRN